MNDEIVNNARFFLTKDFLGRNFPNDHQKSLTVFEKNFWTAPYMPLIKKVEKDKNILNQCRNTSGLFIAQPRKDKNKRKGGLNVKDIYVQKYI